MSTSLIHSITISTATGDGTIVGIARTRTMANLLLADHVEASDFDAFQATPFNGKPGITHSIITQRAPNFLIPDFVWTQLFDLLSTRLQLAALQRGSTAIKSQETLDGTGLTNQPDNSIGLATALPSRSDPKDVLLNNMPMLDALKSLNCSAVTEVHPKHTTYDPHYKDSDIPDDIDLYESDDNDIPF